MDGTARLGTRKRAEMAGWLDNVVILPYPEAVAVTWRKLQARAMRRAVTARRGCTPVPGIATASRIGPHACERSD